MHEEIHNNKKYDLVCFQAAPVSGQFIAANIEFDECSLTLCSTIRRKFMSMNCVSVSFIRANYK